MFVPNQILRNILCMTVKPEYLKVVTERFVDMVTVYNLTYCDISAEESVTDQPIGFTLTVANFDETLECGKWYDREKFDGNPDDHILLECDEGGVTYSRNYSVSELCHDTVKFMYIERP